MRHFAISSKQTFSIAFNSARPVCSASGRLAAVFWQTRRQQLATEPSTTSATVCRAAMTVAASFTHQQRKTTNQEKSAQVNVWDELVHTRQRQSAWIGKTSTVEETKGHILTSLSCCHHDYLNFCQFYNKNKSWSYLFHAPRVYFISSVFLIFKAAIGSRHSAVLRRFIQINW